MLAPVVLALAPDHLALTTRAQPTLAWYVSGPTQARVEFILLADGAVEPTAEVTLESPREAGVQLVSLEKLGVSLEEGRAYEWAIALVLDPDDRDADVLAGGAIERRVAPAALTAELSGGEPSYRALARHGIWYDALADLSVSIAASPGDAGLRSERAALLDQVDLEQAADYDRRRRQTGTGR